MGIGENGEREELVLVGGDFNARTGGGENEKESKQG